MQSSNSQLSSAFRKIGVTRILSGKKLTTRQILYILAFLFLAIPAIFFSIFPNQKTTSNNKPVESVQGSQNRRYFRVVEIVDGDTIKIDYNGSVEPVRLIGIDTPEVVDPRKPVQCFGRDASTEAKKLLSGKNVYIEFDQSQGDRDKYGRLLLYIWRKDDNLFINDYLVRQGFAHEYTYNLPYKYQAQFKAAEAEAREAGRGLWGEVCK